MILHFYKKNRLCVFYFVVILSSKSDLFINELTHQENHL